ncbi:aminotransferase class V-fold PLP-dependent enzyme [Fuchsiella alkaliacetigena]|uniref:aminotransferase class V-fold PLP-dependent enzyme n=1 Tax=Fuchsiella alkaliacetigena TaxID=957042 RepID=UPI00200A513F|nr:aminotransferase class V-fold PLP-dependent enzyme [Fuchsiella alkaliacetigena]MCK8824539.1 aminotransferase class V-fold PLP-dependent enzyme [Fuchsiella alkaliacetigena]
MIYLDNAATSFPKPEAVYEKMNEFMRCKAANPGRSSHQLAVAADKELSSARELLAEFFNAQDSAEIVFTLNATDALNLAIKGVLDKGDHVITTTMEHNSITRPLKFLEKKGIIELSLVNCDSQTGELSMQNFKTELQNNTKLVVITHASNVTGTLMPIAEIGELTNKQDIVFLVDAAQTAGVYPIDVQALGIDLMAFPGHKGLLGPQGTGGLYIRKGLELATLREGGTGSNSEAIYQPQVAPDRYESGTPNGVGIVGLGVGVNYIQEKGVDALRSKKLELTDYLLSELQSIEQVKVYGPQDISKQAPVLSINLGPKNANEIAFILDRAFNIAVRSGLHCAPFAHQTLGTIDQGTVRISLGNFNTKDDCQELIKAIQKIAQELK